LIVFSQSYLSQLCIYRSRSRRCRPHKVCVRGRLPHCLCNWLIICWLKVGLRRRTLANWVGVLTGFLHLFHYTLSWNDVRRGGDSIRAHSQSSIIKPEDKEVAICIVVER
jgi:hypothetical protein